MKRSPSGGAACLMLIALVSSGCLTPGDDGAAQDDGSEATSPPAKAYNGTSWPRLDGVTLTILDHGAFGAFSDAKGVFENLTGAKVEHVEADDTGSALNRAIREKGSPSFDVIYGLDNILLAKAEKEGVLEPYKPYLASRVQHEYVFFDHSEAWPATPVDHGYIGINWDPRHEALAGVTLSTLADVRDHAGTFVTEDPRTSTPGLGFLLATIATYPEGEGYDWKTYWNDLFAGGVLVTTGWTEAYEQHFSGGYGVDYGGAGDRAIVTSYTESPAYEHYFGRAPERLAENVLADNATFHQVQTMAIAKGARNLFAAKVWIEWTLTDDFQKLAAPANAVYPVVSTVSVNDTYMGLDPAPGTFVAASFDYATLADNVEGWVRDWVDLCEAADCA